MSEIELLKWVLGGAFILIAALVALVWSAQTSEIKALRDWKHKDVAPAMRKWSEIDWRVSRLEEWKKDHEDGCD